MLEVQLVNVTALFLISTRLKPAMLRSPHLNRFIINVSSKEGIFRTKRKGRYHVHTNMAKASLNMMTLTMAKDYKRDRIFVNSVDPGWVSNQLPAKVREHIQPRSTVKMPRPGFVTRFISGWMLKNRPMDSFSKIIARWTGDFSSCVLSILKRAGRIRVWRGMGMQ